MSDDLSRLPIIHADLQRRLDEREVCWKCHGVGTIPKAHYLRPGYDALAPSGYIGMHVIGAAFIFEVTREASEISKRWGRPVIFDFMNRDVIVKPDDDPQEIGRCWWKAHYGRTFEESQAER